MRVVAQVAFQRLGQDGGVPEANNKNGLLAEDLGAITDQKQVPKTPEAWWGGPRRWN